MANHCGEPLRVRPRCRAVRRLFFAADAWAWRHFPVVGLSVHSLPPLGPVDVWLHQFEADQPRPWLHSRRRHRFPTSSEWPRGKAPGGPRAAQTGAGCADRRDRRLPITKEISAGNGGRRPRAPGAHPRWVCCWSAKVRILRACPATIRESGPFRIRKTWMASFKRATSTSILSAWRRIQRPPGDARRIPVVSHEERRRRQAGDLGRHIRRAVLQCVDQLLSDEGERRRRGEAMQARFDTVYNLRAATPTLLTALEEGASILRSDANDAMNAVAPRLVVFGLSNILSDLFDAALASGLVPSKVVIHHPEHVGERDLSVAQRLAAVAPLCPQSCSALIALDDFVPEPGELYLLGPPRRPGEAGGNAPGSIRLAFCTLVHPRAMSCRCCAGARCVRRRQFGGRAGDAVGRARVRQVGDTSATAMTRHRCVHLHPSR